jgi:hypothetical protein
MKYEHIGWCKEGTSDKVWGVICLREAETFWSKGKYLTFWGRRGTKLQTKILEGNSREVQSSFGKKLRNGYTEVDKDRLYEVYPEFQQDLEKTAMWASLKL